MSNWQPIETAVHKQAAWQNLSGYSFAKNDTSANLLLAELASALPYFPVGFINDGDEFKLVVIQGLEAGRNLFVNARGQWRVPYVPSAYRAYPFKMRQEDDGSSLLYVDADVVVFDVEPEAGLGQRMFDADGEMSGILKNVFDFLEQCDLGRIATQKAVNALSDAGLIVSWGIQVKLPDGVEQVVDCFYQIDEAKLQGMSGDDLAALNSCHALTVAYAQVLSKMRLNTLAHFYQMSEAEEQAGSPKDVDLDKLFGGEDDSLSF